jgi:hypothetical protein
MEPSLGLSWGIEVKHPDDGTVTERFHDEFYMLGFSPPSRHVNHQYFDIAGFRLAIHPHTIEGMRGKCLSVRNAVVSLAGPERRRDFLVAAPHDANDAKT